MYSVVPSTSRPPAVYQPSTSHLPAVYQPSTSRTRAVYQPSTSLLPAVYQPSTSRLPAVYQSSTSRLPAVYQMSTSHLPAVYEPSTSQVSPSAANYNANGSPTTCKVTKYCELRYEMRVVSRSTINYNTKGSRDPPAPFQHLLAPRRHLRLDHPVDTQWNSVLPP